jgi:hypothetical protein
VSRKAELPQSSRHILIFDEDWEFLDRYYGRLSSSRLGVSVAIRKIVHRKVSELKAQMLAREDRMRSTRLDQQTGE